MTKAEFRRWVDMIKAEIVLPLAWASGAASFASALDQSMSC